MLEDKLRTIKEEVVKKLEQREMTENEYFETVHHLLVEQGLAKSAEWISNKDEFELAVNVGCGVEKKIGAERYLGIENTYIALTGKKLSPAAEQDINNLKRLLEGARAYVKEKTGSGKLMEPDFDKMIRSYVKNQTEIPVSSSSVRDGSIGYTLANLKREFNPLPEPVKIGGIDEAELRRALEKI